MSKITLNAETREIIAQVVRNNQTLIELLTSAPTTPAKAPKTPKAPKTVTPDAQVLESVSVVGRPNGLLTAASAKTIREVLVGTPMAGTNVNGNTEVRVACYVLTQAKVPFAVVESEVNAAEAMKPVRAAKATAPKAERPTRDKTRPVGNTDRGQLPEHLKATPEQAKAVNLKLAEDLREHGVVPQGQAWTAAKKGERGWKKLRKLNRADGLEFKGVGEVPTSTKAVLVADLEPGTAAKDPRVDALVAGGFTEAEALQALSLI